jgi:hypothetical protein
MRWAFFRIFLRSHRFQIISQVKIYIQGEKDDV